MPDPGSSLRSMILTQSAFDLARVRVLCMQVTAAMTDPEQARTLQERVVAAFADADALLALEALDFAGPDLRQHALDAVAAMEKAAHG